MATAKKALGLKSGTRLQIGFDPKVGQSVDFNMVSTFSKDLDSSAFLISVPMKDGKLIPMDENKKIIIRCGDSRDAVIVSAYCDDEVKEGIRHYWKMRKVSEQRQVFQRSDERYKVPLHTQFSQPTWPINAEGKIVPEEAMTLDISAGGAALFMALKMDVGELITIDLPRVGIDAKGAAIEGVIAVICWYREAPKGSIFKNISGVQFRFANDAERSRVKEYIDNLVTVYKLQ